MSDFALILYDRSGNITFHSDWGGTLRILDEVNVGGGPGSLVDARFQDVADGSAALWYQILATSALHIYDQPTLSLAGTTLSWTWPPGSSFPSTLVLYGMANDA